MTDQVNRSNTRDVVASKEIQLLSTCQGISFSLTTSPPTTLTGFVRFDANSGPKMPQFLELLNLLLFKICLEFLSDFLMDFSQHSFFLKTRRSIEIMAF